MLRKTGGGDQDDQHRTERNIARHRLQGVANGRQRRRQSPRRLRCRDSDARRRQVRLVPATFQSARWLAHPDHGMTDGAIDRVRIADASFDSERSEQQPRLTPHANSLAALNGREWRSSAAFFRTDPSANARRSHKPHARLPASAQPAACRRRRCGHRRESPRDRRSSRRACRS